MAKIFPTALEAAEMIKNHWQHDVAIRPLHKRLGIKCSAVHRDECRGIDMRYFDMTLADGRVYRVRVSDITPESGE